MMKRALYIGRFQLFHKGHFDVIKFIEAAGDIDEIVLAVGSSQYSHKNKSPAAAWAANPFTYEERKEMVENSLEGQLVKPIGIFPVPDYHDYPRWFQHIKDNLPEFHCLYTVDKKEREFFEGRGYEVRDFPRKANYHASILRERMYKGQEYKSALTEGTLKVIEKINGEERVKMLFAKDIAESLIQNKG